MNGKKYQKHFLKKFLKNASCGKILNFA